MKNNNLTKIIFLTMLFITLIACKSDKKNNKNQDELTNTTKGKIEMVEITSNAMDFQMQDTLYSGWNTFKFSNKSPYAHFFLLDKYPEGKNIQNTITEVGPPFDKGMEFIMQGKMDEAMAEFGKLPDWFGDIVFTGGSGLLSPGHTSITTVKLEPGLYIIECYVKMADGKFHTSMGMAKELHILEEDSGITPPEADIHMAISSTKGIEFNEPITQGDHTFMVHYDDQIVHENFVGHDINLVKLDENANLDTLEAWMNWATPTGLMDPLPIGVTFLGGTNDAPAGSVQYFQVNLIPGNYAFISEVPNASRKGMLRSFTVGE